MPWIGRVMLDLQTCLCNALLTHGGGQVCLCSVLAGSEVAYDYCAGCGGDTCGQAWVRLVSAFPSSALPDPDADARCTGPLAYALEVGVVRCAPLPAEDGTPPDAGEHLDSALQVAQDMQAMLRAMQCCFSRGVLHVVGEYTPVGPGGGCVGGTWSVTVAP